MQIEDVAGKRFPSRRTAQQQAQLPIGLRVAGQIVVYDQDIAPLGHEPLGDASCSIRREGLQTGWVFAGRNDHYAVGERPAFAQGGDHLGHRRAALTDGTVDADDTLIGLVEHGVHCQGGFAGLAIAQD